MLQVMFLSTGCLIPDTRPLQVYCQIDQFKSGGPWFLKSAIQRVCELLKFSLIYLFQKFTDV